MTKLVVLNLGKGDFRQGFSTVTVQLWEGANVPIQMVGSLPSVPEIPGLYRRWQLLYCLLHEALYNGRNWRKLRNKYISNVDVEIEEEDITNVSLMEFDNLCEELQHQINLWFKSLSFIHINQKLRTKLAPSDEIKFIFETENEEARKIPWHLWDFFEDYPNAAVCLSSSEFEYFKPPVKNPTRPMRILAILGNSEGIDVQKDRAILERTNAQTVFLVEPERRELDHWLWDKQGWDIIFFAGHSYSQLNGETSAIHINKTDSLTIPQLKNALRAALSHGLGLAIFNSCDGLALAHDLASLQIPQIIVMREPVPDAIAQAFLKNFIEAFATGKSLYMSVREAQARLQGLESEYPCASWLPVICQNPAAEPLTWKNKSTVSRHLPKKALLSALLQISLLTTGVTLLMRNVGIMQSWELSAYDKIMRLRPAEQPDSRIVLVTVTEADVQAQSAQERRGASLSDRTLAQIIEKIQRFNPRVIGLDIYRENPVQNEFKNLAFSMRNDNFIAICQGGTDNSDPGVPPPPEALIENVGFSDVVTDPDTILRRQLLAMAPLTTARASCKTDKSFSYRIATRYLASSGFNAKLTSGNNFSIGNKVFQNLKSNSGGYHNIDSQGHQVLVNWRAANPYMKQVTVQEVLNNKLTAENIKNRIVLIGTTAGSFNDRRWSTPYTSGEWPHNQIAGVVVQAHMVSQILSAVLDNRPLLSTLPESSEFICIWCWSLIGGLIALNIKSKRRLIFAVVGSCGVLYISTFYLFILGIWVPLVPCMLVLLGSTVGVIVYIDYHNKKMFVVSRS
jgi:CHASE2 domain-containing sensor protein